MIISHWDTDGIISAAVLRSHLKQNPDHFVSKIGSYSIDNDNIKKINSKKYDIIYIVDYALQKTDVDKLKAGKIIVIDHHFTKKASGVKYYNRVISGASADNYPCTMISLIEFLNKDYLLESCIAAVGDKEQHILKNKTFAKRIKLCKKKFNVDFNKMYKMKKLIDSSYMLGIKKEILRTIKFISEKGVLVVLKNKVLRKQMKQIDSEKKRLMKTKTRKISKNILFYDLKSKYNLISTITRDLSKKFPNKIIVTKLKSSAYVRRDKVNVDLKQLIDLGQKKGWKIGGKHEVLGIDGCNKKILRKVLDYLISTEI